MCLISEKENSLETNLNQSTFLGELNMKFEQVTEGIMNEINDSESNELHDLKNSIQSLSNLMK